MLLGVLFSLLQQGSFGAFGLLQRVWVFVTAVGVVGGCVFFGVLAESFKGLGPGSSEGEALQRLKPALNH